MATENPKPQRTQLMILGIGVLALGVLYWQFVYSPMVEEEQKLEQTQGRLAKDNRELVAEARAQSAMLACKPELDALNRQNELMLPADSEPVAFLKVLTNMAGTAGLAQGPTKKLDEATVKAPPLAADDATEDDAGADDATRPCWEKIPGLAADKVGDATFVRVPFEIEVRGTFHQLAKYFWLIHQHAKDGRIITVENLTLDAPKAGPDGLLLAAKFTAVGYREADRPDTEDAKGAAATKPKSAAPVVTPGPASGSLGQQAKQKVEQAGATREQKTTEAVSGKSPASPGAATPAAPASKGTP